jgi:hypothetical protein
VDAFSQMAQDWSAFFSAVAQVSGGLVGLVFVALTFNTRTLGVDGDPMLKALAQQTFGDFVMLLLVSLVMLVPHPLALSVGLTILLFSTVDMVRIVRNLLRLRRHLRGPGGDWAITRRFVLSGLARLLLGWMGVLLIRDAAGPDAIGSMLFGGVMMLLLSGCRSAWLLVVPERK